MEWSVTDADPRLRRRYRVAFVATAMLLVGIAVTLPFSLASVLDEILGLTTGKVLPLLRPERAALAPVHSRLHLAVTEVDEVHLVATFRLSGHRTCGARCPWRDRLLFVSAQPGRRRRRGPASLGDHHASRNHRGHDRDLSAPAQRRADPVSVRRVPSDRGHGPAACSPGRPRREPGRPTRSRAISCSRSRSCFLTCGCRSPMRSPPEPFRRSGAPVVYAAAYALAFERPRYLRVLAVLLVLSIAAAAAYSVFLRPLEDLVVSSGALVLGIWGVRAVIVPVNLHFQTAVDLALSIVILVPARRYLGEGPDPRPRSRRPARPETLAPDSAARSRALIGRPWIVVKGEQDAVPGGLARGTDTDERVRRPQANGDPPVAERRRQSGRARGRGQRRLALAEAGEPALPTGPRPALERHDGKPIPTLPRARNGYGTLGGS